MSSKHLVFALVILAAKPVIAQATAPAHAAATTAVKKPAATTQKSATEGDRIFQQQCSRCHTAPEGFSTRISGAIVMHMRVRAGISDHDAKELFRFFNP